MVQKISLWGYKDDRHGFLKEITALCNKNKIFEFWALWDRLSTPNVHQNYGKSEKAVVCVHLHSNLHSKALFKKLGGATGVFTVLAGVLWSV